MGKNLVKIRCILHALHGNFPETILDKSNANVYSDKDHLAKPAKFGLISKDRKNVKFVNQIMDTL